MSVSRLGSKNMLTIWIPILKPHEIKPMCWNFHVPDSLHEPKKRGKSLPSSCARGWISLLYNLSWTLKLWEVLGLTLCPIQCLSFISCPYWVKLKFQGSYKIDPAFSQHQTNPNINSPANPSHFKFLLGFLWLDISFSLLQTHLHNEVWMFCSSFLNVCRGRLFTEFKLLLIIRCTIIFCTTARMGWEGNNNTAN